MTILNYIFLQVGAPKSQLPTYIMMGLIVVIFYFFMIRPQNKRRKEMMKFRAEIQKGDKVMTTGGIHGKIADVKDDTVTLEIDNNVRIKVEKSVIIKDSSDLMMQR